MNNSNNIEVVKKFLESQYAGDFDTAFGQYALPEFTWIVGSHKNERLKALIPWAGYEHYGREGYQNLTNMLFGEFEPLTFEPQHFTDAGDRVFVEGHFTFRHRQTEKIADSDFIALFRFKEGKISGGQFYENTADVAAARK
jgi:uncharacterized protein